MFIRIIMHYWNEDVEFAWLKYLYISQNYIQLKRDEFNLEIPLNLKFVCLFWNFILFIAIRRTDGHFFFFSFYWLWSFIFTRLYQYRKNRREEFIKIFSANFSFFLLNLFNIFLLLVKKKNSKIWGNKMVEFFFL